MKSILLSFSNEWYPPLKDGLKIYEHRKRFCKEEVKAYLYIGKPIHKVVAIVTLGKRIALEDWLQQYKHNPATFSRIMDFKQRNNYAMPIIDFQEIIPISLDEYKQKNKRFIVPRSYYYLDNNVSLNDYLVNNTHLIGDKKTNFFPPNIEDIICTY